eukprot:SAG11_NODE_85_length_17370_cov_29.272017_9_plen_81_part_00
MTTRAAARAMRQEAENVGMALRSSKREVAGAAEASAANATKRQRKALGNITNKSGTSKGGAKVRNRNASKCLLCVHCSHG